MRFEKVKNRKKAICPNLLLFSWVSAFFKSICKIRGKISTIHILGGKEFLVPRPGMEPMSPELEVQSLHHWPTREVPQLSAF